MIRSRAAPHSRLAAPRAANTHVHVRNDGPHRLPVRLDLVRLDLVDHDGRGAQPIGYSPILDAGASSSFVFGATAPGAAVELIFPRGRLKDSVEIHPDDEDTPEIRTPIPYHARQVPPD